MASFELYGTCNINKEDVTIDYVSCLLLTSLRKYYDDKNVTSTSTGINVNGNLKSFWERAITKADINLSIEGHQLSYRVDGTSSLGVWSWVWFLLGLFTGFFLVWFVFDVIEFLISRDRPKKYIEVAFKAVEFEIGKSSEGVSLGERKCPFCAETVKTEAKLCRFCGKDLPEIIKEMKIASPPDTIHEIPPNIEYFVNCTRCNTNYPKGTSVCPDCQIDIG